jgi:hypothetical protein
MNRRTVAILLAIVVLVLLPALCLGGLLEHACGCDAGACGHEGDCASDPCADTIARGGELDNVLGLPAPEQIGSVTPVAVASALAFGAAVGGPRRWDEVNGSPPVSRLPFHASDVPLRI